MVANIDHHIASTHTPNQHKGISSNHPIITTSSSNVHVQKAEWLRKEVHTIHIYTSWFYPPHPYPLSPMVSPCQSVAVAKGSYSPNVDPKPLIPCTEVSKSSSTTQDTIKKGQPFHHLYQDKPVQQLLITALPLSCSHLVINLTGDVQCLFPTRSSTSNIV
jgi:hypothetical protein